MIQQLVSHHVMCSKIFSKDPLELHIYIHINEILCAD